MPINMKDLNSLFTSVTQSKLPSSGIAFVLGLEHGIRITPDTHHAFQMGAKVGRLKATMGNARGSSGGFGGSGRGDWPGANSGQDRGFRDDSS